MRKYFSSVICSKGTLCAYNSIYKKDVTSKVFIIYGGDDFERAVFFNRLVKNLKGYYISVFNPFYDESVDGIYIENLNTYIISGHSKVSPVLLSSWEKPFQIADDRNYPIDLRREIIILKSKENQHYKKASEFLHNASLVKEKLHTEISPYLNEEKVINYVHRFIGKTLKNTKERDTGLIRLLSSPTPLGIHTYYDTIYDMCDNVINIVDSIGFVGSIILGIIKDYATIQRIPLIMNPSYFANDIPQTLIFPTMRIGITITDENHKLSFEAQETVNTLRFFTSDKALTSQKTNALLSVENKLLDDCVLNIYEGRDCRFKYNSLTVGFENQDEVIENADILFNQLIN